MDSRLLSVLRHHRACTRLADLTGFTTLGLPVWACIRPNGKSGSSTVGKGMSNVNARLSALFECYELTCAERLNPEELSTTAPRHMRYMFHPPYSLHTENFEVCVGRSLMNNQEVRIPFGYLSMDMTRLEQAYLCSTIGTGAGSTAELAIRSATREFIERYSIYLSKSNRGNRRRLALERWDAGLNSDLRDLVQLCLESQCEILAQDYTQVDGWPCFAVLLVCRQTHQLMVGNGYGCDPDPAWALTQAILEAHQGLCIGVSGMRDDMFKATYFSSRAEQCRWGMNLQVKHPVISLAELMECRNSQILEDAESLMNRLVLFRYPTLDPGEQHACYKVLMPI